jgi:hydrogenase maturation protease
MVESKARCLILSCGNTLRGDDGIGPFLAVWAEKRFQSHPEILVITRQQWTPELAEDIVRAESVLFIDCSVESPPGSIALEPVMPAAAAQALGTHHLSAAELLALAKDFYSSLPRIALQLSIGAASLELSEDFSDPVNAALPDARKLLEEAVLHLVSIPGVPPALDLFASQSSRHSALAPIEVPRARR